MNKDEETEVEVAAGAGILGCIMAPFMMLKSLWNKITGK